ncbi:MAG: hypothetical protein J0G30_10830 [Actinomycetales bacterium]|nr:hypothetical protein [Actinomycetales bacterium]
MTKLSRSLAATAASAAVAAGLLLGVAAPASATPDASTTADHRASAGIVKPPIVFPSCKSMVPAATVRLWGVAPTLSDRYGSTAADLIAVITARPSATCTWKKGTFGATAYGTISEVAISPADFAYLRDWYRAHGYVESAHNPATQPGTAADLIFNSTSPKGRGGEMVFLSPDGWWVTASQVDAGSVSTGILGSFTYDAVDVFLDLNPTRV